jgi:branched-chain amino acid transport system permease protein
MHVDYTQFLQLALQGISTGAIYSLVALGLVLSYKATEVLSFAHGDILMLSAFLAWWLIVGLNWSFWLAFPTVVLAIAVFSYFLEAKVMRRIVGQPQFAAVMLTIGLAHMIRGGVSMVFTPESRTYSTPWTGHVTSIGGAVIADLNLVIIAAALLTTVALFAFLRLTSLGVAIQAASQNQLAAFLCGIRVKRLTSIVWAVCGALAALCGILLAPISLVDLGLWFVLIKALAALVVGGFGSVPGAILGGLLIGLVEQFSGVYLPDGFKDIMPSIVLIVVLVLFPRGLLGQSHGRRV